MQQDFNAAISWGQGVIELRQYSTAGLLVDRFEINGSDCLQIVP